MSSEPVVVTGIVLILVGAFASGSFGLILKYSRKWEWEHIWLIYSVFGMLVIPWTMGFTTISDLLGVLRSADRLSLIPVFLYGLGWGLGAVLYGLALKMVGLALSFAIVMGLTAAIGSFAPLVLLHRAEMNSPRGQLIIVGVLLIVIGVLISAWAGHLKEKVLGRLSRDAVPAWGRRTFTMGVFAAVCSGVFSPMLNLSFAYGTPLARAATEQGTDPTFSANIIWVVALSAGFLVNAVYCVHLIIKRGSWHVLGEQSFHYLLALIMAVLWSAGYIFYGIGGSRLGELAAVVGWPLMSSMTIISANFWGVISGEWANTGRRPLWVMSISVALLCLGMTIVGWSEILR